MKKYIAIVLIIIIALIGYVSLKETDAPMGERLSVVTSFYPLSFLASEIGGEYVAVYNITPAGAEPHEYEPTPKDMIRMEESDLILINGGGLEPWEHDVLEHTAVEALIVGEPLMTLVGEAHDHEEEGRHEDEDHHEDDEVLDPHVWLSPTNAIAMADIITTAFSKADPEHAVVYESNKNALVQKLQKLNTDYQNSLAVCASRTIVTSHAAFGYLAHAYELEQLSISGLSPETEPSPARMTEIVHFAEEHDVSHIFFEELVSPRLAETIAHEIGAKTLVLNPLEGLTKEQLDDGENYISVMYTNLDALVEGLSCTL